MTHYYRPTQCSHYGNTRSSERSAHLETHCYDDALSMRSFSQTVTALRSDIVTHCYRATVGVGTSRLRRATDRPKFCQSPIVTALRSDIVTHCYRPTQCWHYGNTRSSESSAHLETHCYDDAVGVGTSRRATRDRPKFCHLRAATTTH